MIVNRGFQRFLLGITARVGIKKTHRTIYKSKFGVNDPALTQTSDGKILLRVCELNVSATSKRKTLPGPLLSHRVEHGLTTTIKGNTVLEFNTNLTTSLTKKPVKAATLSASCSREPVIELPDGSWLLSVYMGAPQKTDSSYLLRSFNRGQTWGDDAVLAEDQGAGPSDLQGINFNETSMISLGGGEMVAMIRADESFFTEKDFMPVGGIGSLYSSHSFNWGLSWTKPKKTELFGQPAHLLDLGDGRILCTYGYRRKPYGVRACLSDDKGRTWNSAKEIILRDDGAGWDLGYPMTIPVGGESLFTVYYFNDVSNTRFIAGTFWELE